MSSLFLHSEPWGIYLGWLGANVCIFLFGFFEMHIFRDPEAGQLSCVFGWLVFVAGVIAIATDIGIPVIWRALLVLLCICAIPFIRKVLALARSFAQARMQK
jgi:hypothetical protein